MADPALEAWIEANYALLLRYATYQTFGDADRGQELLHIVLARLLEGRVVLDLSQSPKTFIQWMMRTSWRDVLLFHDVSPVDPNAHEDGWETQRALVWTLLPALTLRQQQAVRGVWAGQSYEEIGRETGQKWRRVQRHFQAGVKRLQGLVRVRVGDGSINGRGRWEKFGGRA